MLAKHNFFVQRYFIMKLQQAGFTLIEFMIVIVILCIILIVALPRIDLWEGVARETKLKELEHAMRLANSLVYAKACCNNKHGFVTIRGQEIQVEYGYIRDASYFAMLIDGVGKENEMDENVHFWADNMGVRYANTSLGGSDSCGVEYMPPQGMPGMPGEMNPTYILRVEGC
jgi:prepilin-type N-terminal cleavage/methylation domain-containing protein